LPLSEPKATADRVEEVVPGVWYWSIEDERIGGYVGSGHAVRDGDGVVLIDPLPLRPAALSTLGRVSAIVLTAGTHQRSSWRLRRELGAPIHAPAAVRLVDEEPDSRYSEGDELPAGLQPIFAPGPGTTQHSLLLPRDPRVLFTSDLFVHQPGEELSFVPDEYVHDPAQTRETARRTLELDFDVLCVGHGQPVREDPKAAIRALLARG
jgi:glyoxylase-like metal-dependent hydrolase (beta-lactamase superfamily II)